MVNDTLYAPVGSFVHAAPLSAGDVEKLQAASPGNFADASAGDHLVVYPSGLVQTMPPATFANHFTPATAGGFSWRDALKDVGFDAIRSVVVDLLEHFVPASSSEAPAAPAAASGSTDPNDRPAA